MKRNVKTLVAGLLMFAMVFQTLAGFGFEAKANGESDSTEEYRELKLSEWNQSVCEGDNYQVYKLSDAKDDLSSLDGVAVSAKLNFNGASARIRIGGTEKIPQGGFSFVNTAGELKVYTEVIDGTAELQTIVASTEWKVLQSQDIDFRAEFRLHETKWKIKVSINGKLRGEYDLGAATPGVYYTNVGEVTVKDSYRELQLSDWNQYVGEVYGRKVYKLSDIQNDLSSLDGVAVSAKLNFNGVKGARVLIGGTDAVKNGGISFVNDANQLQVYTEEIGGNTTLQTVVSSESWNALQSQEIDFRAEFNKSGTEWLTKVYINGQSYGSYTLGAATPGLYSANGKDVTVKSSYQELNVSDWTANEGDATTKIYQLDSAIAGVHSLDGVAVNGSVNFHGTNGARLRIGGTSTAQYAGIAFLCISDCLKVLPEAIGGASELQTIIEATEWTGLKARDIAFRAEFRRVNTIWYATVYVNGSNRGTYNLGEATPGMYLACVNGTGIGAGYTELTFADWNRTNSTYKYSNYSTYVYDLPEGSSYESLDQIAVSGKVNYNGHSSHPIAIGSTDSVKNGGFWLKATEENKLQLSAQAIGVTGSNVTEMPCTNVLDREFLLRMTFENDVTEGTWTVAIYVDGTYVGEYSFASATPGIHIAIPEDVSVEGKNVVHALTGTSNTYTMYGQNFGIGVSQLAVQNQQVVVYRTGDITLDNQCNVVDLVRTKKQADDTATENPALAAKLAVDFDKNDKLENADAAELRQYILEHGDLSK